MYPKFEVPGVRPEDIYQLFNVSNYEYYRDKVKALRSGSCSFCKPDQKRFICQNQSWYIMENTVAPQSGQDHQFVIPCVRHIESIQEMVGTEWLHLSQIVEELHKKFDIPGGVLLVRSGDPARNAKSMPHLHFNYLVPTGRDRVTVTIAKSAVDLVAKLRILQIFEKMRLLEESGTRCAFNWLDQAEKDLVQDKLGSKGAC